MKQKELVFSASRLLPVLLAAVLVMAVCCAQQENGAECSSTTDRTPLDYRALDMETLRKNFANPPMPSRPFAIWFWFSNDVTREEVTRELEEMSHAGIGGVEIRIIDDFKVKGSLRPEPRIRYLDDEWLSVFEHLCSEAKRLGMIVGLNPGMGWIYGGPWITKENQSRRMQGTEILLQGPTVYDAFLPIPERPKLRDITSVSALAWRIDDASPGKEVLAETFKNLTDRITRQEANSKSPYHLKWDVPEGKWLLGTFVVWGTGHPDHVRSPGGAGRSFDPFSIEAARIQWENVMCRIKNRAGRYFGTTVTEVATDSWEYGANWSPQIPKAFPKKAGYDLIPRMHVFLGYGPEEKQIRSDVKKVSQELLVENFFMPITRWCREDGLLHRPQAYGRPSNNLFDAYFHSDIPEVEQGERPPEAFWVAHTCGKPLVSSEALTFFGGSRATMEGIRKEVNGSFADGVNRIDFHSWSYSPPEAGVPGWRMYVPFHINRTVAWLPFAGHLNTWISRSQWLLQAGGPVAEAVVYGHGIPETGTPYPVDAVNTTTFRCLRKRGGKVPYDFKYLVLQGDLSTEEALRVVELAKSGVKVLWQKAPASWDALGQAPAEGPGGPQNLGALFGSLEQEGKILRVQDPWSPVAQNASVTWDESQAGGSLRYLHRRVKGGEIFFVVNVSRDKSVDTRLVFRVEGGLVPEVWDTDAGTMTQVALYRRTKNGVEVPVRLPPLEHVFVIFSSLPEQLHAVESDADAVIRDKAGDLYAVMTQPGEYSVALSDGSTRRFSVEVPATLEIKGRWRIAADSSNGHGLKEESVSERLEKLISWTEVPALSGYLGTARYTTTFDLPSHLLKPELGLELDLGDVRQVARVWINDKLIGTAWHSPFRLDVTGLLQSGANKLRIDVANLEYFLKEQVPSGLIGPVVIRSHARLGLD